MTSEEVLNTMAKVKGLVPTDQFRDIELKSKQITVDHTRWIGNKGQNINLDEIRTALSENKLIFFKYLAQNGIKSERKIEPYRLVLKSLTWYLQGYCTTRNDFRTFKLSRISSLELLEETFIPREFDYKALEILNNTKKKIIPLKLVIDESILDLITEFCGAENIKPHGSNKFIVSFPFTEDDFSYSMILRLGDKCECLEPENVRLEIIRRVEDLLSIYKKEEWITNEK